MSKRIAILCEQFYFWDLNQHQQGGGESYLINLYRNLTKEGYEVKIYQFSYEKGTKKYEDSFGSFNVIGLGNISNKQYGFESLQRGVDEFLEICKDFDLRILLTVNLAYKPMPKPTISIFHGIYWNFQSDMYKQPDWNENYLKKWTRNVDAIVSVDTDCINLVRACYPKNIERFYFIPNFVDCSRFVPSIKTSNTFDVLYARRINELRGIRLFLQTAKELTEKYSDITFTICGHGLYDTELQIKNFCKDYKNCRHISFKNSEMHKVYPNYDLNVIPSIASEGLSLSMLEGMSCGLATIGTDVGGIPNGLIDGYNGLMIRANQQQELTDAIEWCYLNRDKVKEYGQNGYKLAQAFDKKIWDKRWLDLINKTISK
jgi:glycosyltransferase involved in cell wall biosynthesis